MLIEFEEKMVEAIASIEDWWQCWSEGEVCYTRTEGQNTLLLFHDRLELKRFGVHCVLYFSSLPYVGDELLKIFHKLNSKNAVAILGYLNNV